MTLNDRLLRDFGATQHVQLLVFGAPGQLQSLAEQECGRTIPLANNPMVFMRAINGRRVTSHVGN
jgi:hypothetical protein